MGKKGYSLDSLVGEVAKNKEDILTKTSGIIRSSSNKITGIKFSNASELVVGDGQMPLAIADNTGSTHPLDYSLLHYSSEGTTDYLIINTNLPFTNGKMVNLKITGRALFGQNYTCACEVKIGFYCYQDKFYAPFVCYVGALNVWSAFNAKPVLLMLDAIGNIRICIPASYLSSIKVSSDIPDNSRWLHDSSNYFGWFVTEGSIANVASGNKRTMVVQTHSETSPWMNCNIPVTGRSPEMIGFVAAFAGNTGAGEMRGRWVGNFAVELCGITRAINFTGGTIAYPPVNHIFKYDTVQYVMVDYNQGGGDIPRFYAEFKGDTAVLRQTLPNSNSWVMWNHTIMLHAANY